MAESRSKQGGIRLWSLSGGVPVAGPIVAVPGMSEGASPSGSLRWSPDGRGLSISTAAMVRVFDVRDDGSLTERWATSCSPKDRTRTAWRPDGSALAIALGDSVVLLDAETGARTFELSFRLASREFVTVVEWDPEGQRVAAGTTAGMFGVNVETRTISIDVGSHMVTGARWWSSDVVVFAMNDRLLAWNTRRQEGAGEARFDDYVKALTLSADRTLAAVMLRGRLVVVRTPEPRYGPEPVALEVVADMPLGGVKKPVGYWAEFHPTAPRLAAHTGNSNAIQIYDWDPVTLT